MWVILLLIFLKPEGYIAGIPYGGYTCREDSLLFVFQVVMGLDTFPLYIVDLENNEIRDTMFILKGNGPGELKSVFGFGGFFCHRDTLFIYDRYKGLIMVYSIKTGQEIGEVVVGKREGNLVGMYKGEFVFSSGSGIKLGKRKINFVKFRENNVLMKKILSRLYGLVRFLGDTLYWIHPVKCTIVGYDLKKGKMVLKKKAPGKLRGEVKIRDRGKSVAVVPDKSIVSFVANSTRILLFRNSIRDKSKRYLVSFEKKKKRFHIERDTTFIYPVALYKNRFYYFQNDTLFFTKLMR